MVRSAGTSGGPSKKKHPLPARSNAASSLEESRQRYKVSTFGSSGPRKDSGLCRGLKSIHPYDYCHLTLLQIDYPMAVQISSESCIVINWWRGLR